MANPDKFENDPIDLVLHIVGAKWTIPIVRELINGPRRPSELSKAIKGISPKTLTDRLRDLEKWELVSRTAFQEIPPRVVYALTERGLDLLYVMEALRDLGGSWQHAIGVDVPDRKKTQCAFCFELVQEESADQDSNEEKRHQQTGTAGDGKRV